MKFNILFTLGGLMLLEEQMTQIAFATHEMTDIASGVINDSGSNKQDASIQSSPLSFSQCIPPFI
jgi:hypothetical protein